jgi:hypothetical protein
MGLGIKNVIMTNHMITLITSSTTDHRLMFYPSLYDEFFMKFVILSLLKLDLLCSTTTKIIKQFSHLNSMG